LLFEKSAFALPVKSHNAYVSYAPNLVPKYPWTCQEVSRFCEGRWAEQNKKIRSCIRRNQRKIGREKMPGEMQELEVIEIQVNDLIRKRRENNE
jgi:hypothetical protein